MRGIKFSKLLLIIVLIAFSFLLLISNILFYSPSTNETFLRHSSSINNQDVSVLQGEAQRNGQHLVLREAMELFHEVPLGLKNESQVQKYSDITLQNQNQSLSPSNSSIHVEDNKKPDDISSQKVQLDPPYKKIFYTKRDTNVFPFLRSKYLSSLEYFAQVNPSKDQNSPEKNSLGADMMENVFNALRFGRVCNSTSIVDSLTEPIYKSPVSALLESLKVLLPSVNPLYFIEYSSVKRQQTLSYHFSTQFPDMSSLLIHLEGIYQESRNNVDLEHISSGNLAVQSDLQQLECGEKLQHHSNFFVSLDRSSSFDLSNDEWSCVQVIEDLRILVKDLLPFEYEQTLGRMICRCNITYIPSDYPTDFYFASWESLPKLLDAAVRSVSLQSDLTKLSCAVDYSMQDLEESYLKSVRSSHVVIRRNHSTVEKRETVANEKFLTVQRLSELTLDHGSRDNILSAATSLSTELGINGLEESKWFTDQCVYGSSIINCSVLAEEFARRFLAVSGGTSGEKETEAAHSFSWSSSSTDTKPKYSSYSHSSRYSSRRLFASSSEEEHKNETDRNTHHIRRYSDSSKMTSTITNTAGSDTKSSSSNSRPRRTYTSRSYSSRYTKKTESEKRMDDSEPLGPATEWDLPSALLDPADEVDVEIDYHLKQLGKAEKTSATTSPSKSEERRSISPVSRSVQESLQRRERTSYEQWRDLLQRNGIESVLRSKLVYVIGSQITLLSVKLAKQMAESGASSGMVVSLHSDSLAVETHRSLVSMMNLHNQVLCRPDWSFTRIGTLLGAPERSDVAVIQADVILRLLGLALQDVDCDVGEENAKHDDFVLNSKTEANIGCIEEQCRAATNAFEEALSSLIILTSEAWLESPSPRLIRAAVELLMPSCVSVFSEKYSEKFSLVENIIGHLNLGATFHVHEQRLESDETSSTEKVVFITKIVIDYTLQSLNLSTPEQNGDPQPEDRGTRRRLENAPSIRKSFFDTRGSDLGISLYTAIHFGVIDTQRRELLKLLIDLPLWHVFAAAGSESLDSSIAQGVVPWKVFLRLRSYGDGERSEKSVHWSLRLGSDGGPIGPLTGPADSSNSVGVSQAKGSPGQDRQQGRAVWSLLRREIFSRPGELAGGEFSFVEHNSGFGYVSMRVAAAFPNATVLSLESDSGKATHHVEMVKAMKLWNNAVCIKTSSDASVYKNIYESPELFRFQLLSHHLLEEFVHVSSLAQWGEQLGTMLSVALSSFLYVPRALQVSWAMHVMFGEMFVVQKSAESGLGSPSLLRYFLPGPFRNLNEDITADTNIGKAIDRLQRQSSLASHPRISYTNFESEFLLSHARVAGGSSSIKISPMFNSARDLSVDKDEQSVTADQDWAARACPFVRGDVVNMTRHVHHHYDYSKDGHTRTYTMRVAVDPGLSRAAQTILHGNVSTSESQQLLDGIQLVASVPPVTVKGLIDLKTFRSGQKISKINQFIIKNSSRYDLLESLNRMGEWSYTLGEKPGTLSAAMTLPKGYHPLQGGVVGVHLYRDTDKFAIPYVSIRAITLISALRLGLAESLRERMFTEFLRMPLYEDMAPWNVVLTGKELAYIDYDTRDITFDRDVPNAYRVMTVLMNYKRTVEDFKRCGSKAHTVYGLAFISDCVGTGVEKSFSCPSLQLPVPCADGKCHTDYISCLRSLSNTAEELVKQRKSSSSSSSMYQGQLDGDEHLVAAMKAMVGKFNEATATSYRFEDFLKGLN